jgi:VWFA-related protein
MPTPQVSTLTALLAAVLSLATPSAVRPQAPPAPPAPKAPEAPEAGSFPAGVELVVVDAVVLDRDGGSVAGLTRDDFTLKEDGVIQTIGSFEAVGVPDAPTPSARKAMPPLARRISSNTGPVASTGRTFSLVFDELHLTRETAGYARAAVAEFLRQGVQEGDLVTLIGTGGKVWQSVRMREGRDELLAALERLEGRHRRPEALREQVSDYEAMQIHVHQDPRVARLVTRRFAARGVLDRQDLEEQIDPQFGVAGGYYSREIDPVVKIRAAEAYRLATLRNRATLDLLERALTAQALQKGRKSLVFVSQGFVYDTQLEELRLVSEAARRANVAIYFVDARGLTGMPATFSAETRFGEDPRSPFTDLQDAGHAIFQAAEEAAGSETVASESGGFSIKNTNDLASGIRRIADESRHYYLLGYTPTNTKRDGAFRKIEVEVRGERLAVRARKGYHAAREGEQAAGRRGRDADIQQALDAAHPLPGVPLRMTAYVLEETAPGKAKVVVVTDVDVRELAFKESEGRLVDTLEFLLAVVRHETGEYFRYDEKADMKLLPATRERLASTGYPIVRDLELTPGAYRSKIVVRDKASGTIGSVTHEFEVPDLSQWRISTPVLSDALDQGEGRNQRPRAALSARRVFVPGEPFFCEFAVHGAAKDPATGRPRVMSGHALQDGRGSTLFVVEPTTISPSSSGAVVRLIGLATAGLPPGDYALNLFVQDQVSGKVIDVLEPFRLAPAPGPEQAAKGSR